MNKNLQYKLERLKSGGRPRVLDLFAGCGGISLGFHAAGFEISAAVEFDPDAAATHAINFHGGDSKHSPALDITKTSPAELAGRLGLGEVGGAIDVIVGGPPCQAFARVGRSKLREIDEHPEAFRHDPRSRLYLEYLKYVEAFKPLAVLVENVPDMLNHGGQNIAQEICEVLGRKGYICAYTLLNAAFYGVPQMRERMFLIAYRTELSATPVFPFPTNWLVLPPGYEGSRAVALKMLNGGLAGAHNYVEPPASRPDLPSAVTAKDALGDLPPLHARQLLTSGELRRGARRLDESMLYGHDRDISGYGRRMRTWPGFEGPRDGLRDHVIRYLPRDYPLFARMDPGDQYPEAHAHALKMFEEKLAQLRRRHSEPNKGTKEYQQLRNSIVPPYDVGKFPNKWRKMWADQPARTLMAHLGKDSYSHIHYDDEQARTISVREAARLQSFPDGFRFAGTMNPAFKQIGNAVPPLMSMALAREMIAALQPAASHCSNAITVG